MWPYSGNTHWSIMYGMDHFASMVVCVCVCVCVCVLQIIKDLIVYCNSQFILDYIFYCTPLTYFL